MAARPSPSRAAFIGGLLAGALLRVAVLPLPGTYDVDVWKIWSYNAATHSVSRLYGVGGSPPERRVIHYGDAETTIDYPPVALYELGFVGRLYRSVYPRFPNTTALVVAIKSALVAAEIGLALVVFLAIRRWYGTGAARWATLGVWLNPGLIMDGPVLGYLDPLLGLPIVAAFACAALGWGWLTGALAVLALLTKAQALVVLPALALAVPALAEPGRRARRFTEALAGGTVTVAVCLSPIVRAGAFPNFLQAMARLGQHDMLSANACNAWWIVTYITRAMYSLDLGAWRAFTTPTKILQISRWVELGYPDPRLIGTAAFLLAFGWALWRVRLARDMTLVAATAAFSVHAYTVLSAQVHENHLYLALPLSVIAAAGRPALRPIAGALAVILALNLNLFYGLGEPTGYALPRGLTVIDATVWLAGANCAALAWHARLLHREADAPALPGSRGRTDGGPTATN